MSFMTLHATAAEPYQDGNISTTYTAIFEDIASKLKLTDDYVFYRSGQYEYKMYTGELRISGTTISGSGLKSYTITTGTGSYNQNNTYQYSVQENQSLTLNCGDDLVYSNLGDYPNLIERGDNIETALLLLGGIAFVCFLTSRIFSFSTRLRR